MLVEDDDVGAQALQPPVLLRFEHLRDERQRVLLADADEHDRADRRRCRAPRAPAGRACSAPARRGSARSEPSRYRTRDASRSYSSASSLEMPRWRSVMCACVDASANVRAAALGSRYFCASAMRGFVVRRHAGGERQPHEPARREPHALAQAHDRDRARRRSCPRATGRRAPRGRRARGRGRGSGCGRSRIRPRPAARPSRLSTWKAQISSASKPPGRRRQNSADALRRNSVSTNSLPNAGCARSVGRRARARSRRSW